MNLAISELRESFKLIGYDDNDIVDDYLYVSKKKKLNIDFVLFSDSNKKDIDTSCISVCKKDDYIEINDYFEAFNSIGTPIAIIMDNDNTSFYSLNRDIEKSKKFQVIKNANVKEFIIENRLSFSCDSIMKIENESQLSLFSIDYSLKELAKQINKKLLNEKVERTFFFAKSKFKAISNENLEKLLMLILTVLILNDKGYLEDKYTKLDKLLESAIKLYPGYFHENLFNKANFDILKLIYEQLREEVVYDRLTDDMLGSFYEEFLITDNLRKQLGIHYTPSYVARDILERLPIEDIPKDRRVVLDGTCGHGSLILAAYDRLMSMQKLDKNEQLAYIKERLIGIDKDDTATDIAKLLLLLKSLDRINGWKIFGKKDFLKENLNKYTKIRPTIIVANPPFGEEGRSKEEIAEKFVEKYLDWLEDDGLMGIVLPSTFFEKDSCKNMRYRINNECEILEMWTLPPGIFTKANFSSTVLLLRKRQSDNNTVLRYIKKNDRKLYSIANKSSYSSFVPAKLMWNESNNMNLMFDYNVWEKLHEFDALGKLFEVKNGLQVIGEEKSKALFKDYKQGRKKWIQKSANLDTFTLRWSNDRDPNYIDLNAKIHRDRKEIKKFIENRKVVINSKYNPDTLWRLYACIDEEGIFVNETFHIIYPKDGVSKEMLDKVQIILNSIVANLWVYTYSRKRSISPEIIQSIPICEIEGKVYAELKLIVEEIKKIKHTNESSSDEVKKLLYKMDDIIMNCYGFNNDMKQTLRNFFDGYSRKGFKANKKLNQSNTEKILSKSYEKIIITGIVEDIQLKEQRIKLMINGIEELFWLDSNQDFPGWLLKVGTTFKATVYRTNDEIVNICDFKQLGYSIFDDFNVFDDFFNESNIVFEGSEQ